MLAKIYKYNFFQYENHTSFNHFIIALNVPIIGNATSLIFHIIIKTYIPDLECIFKRLKVFLPFLESYLIERYYVFPHHFVQHKMGYWQKIKMLRRINFLWLFLFLPFSVINQGSVGSCPPSISTVDESVKLRQSVSYMI